MTLVCGFHGASFRAPVGPIALGPELESESGGADAAAFRASHADLDAGVRAGRNASRMG